jgi:hypothetical protein
MFKPDIINTNKRGELTAWSSISGIDYIKNPEKATYNAGYILDLSFLNIPFVTTNIQTNIYYALNYKVQVIVILGRRKVLLKQIYYYILKAKLNTFLALIQASVTLLLKANNLFILKKLDKLVAQLAIALSLAIKTIRKLD